MKRCPRCGGACLPAQAFCPACGAPLSTAALIEGDPYVGTIFADRYVVEEKLGEGGMGAVYKARSLDVGRTVALKVMHQRFFGDEVALKRFEREARLASSLRHPHSITIFDYGYTPSGLAYMVMEFLSGQSLADRLASGPVTLPVTLSVMRQLLSVLEAAHALGIIHRDLKPANIFLVSQGGREDFVKVLDFGVARSRRARDADRVTKTGVVAGTPEYMSPEQARGMEQDARSDIYSAGIIFYEMLTGIRPFDGESAAEIMAAQIHKEPQPPSHLSNVISPSLDAIVLWALAKDPGERIGSARAFLDLIDKWSEVTKEVVGRYCVRCSRPLASDDEGPLCASCAAAVDGDELQSVSADDILEERREAPTSRARTMDSAIRMQAGFRRGKAGNMVAAQGCAVSSKQPFVGRRTHLEFLERAVGREGVFVARFVGKEGVGRTRTALELMGRAASEGRTALTAAPGAWNVPGPLEAVRSVALSLLNLPCEPVGEVDLVEPAVNKGLSAEDLPGLMELFGLPSGIDDVVRRRIARAETWRRLVMASAASRALLLLFDDIDSMDGASRELVLALAATDMDESLSVLVTHGESFVTLWPPATRMVELAGLDSVEQKDFVMGLVGGRFPGRIIDEVLSGSDGLPLALRERVLFRCAHPVDDMPASLPDVILARAFRLPPVRNRRLQIASVAGPVVLAGLIEEMDVDSGQGPDDEPVGKTLEALASEGFLIPEGGQYRFVHPFHRQVVRSGIPTLIRQRYHARAAALVARYGASVEEQAYHWWESGQSIGHVDLFIEAGRRYLDQLDEEDAELFFGRALEALKQPDATLSGSTGEQWLSAIEGLAFAMVRTGRRTEAEELLSAAIKRAERISWHKATERLGRVLEGKDQ